MKARRLIVLIVIAAVAILSTISTPLELQDALAAVNSSATATACDSLTAFINASQAQSGKKLTADQVKPLVDAATQIKSDLGCQ